MFSTVVLASLWTSFANPSAAARPWCYHWWVNGNVDRETITADLEAMKELGFGGVNMLDSRGYWDSGVDHVKVPPVKIQWGTEAWYDLVEHELRECARLGLTFTMNAACSGGTMSRVVDGKIVETEIMDRDAVFAHLDAAIGPLLRRCPDLVGTTFTHLYTVSYEGGKAGGSWKRIKDSFYAAMVDWAARHRLKVYSESGGPWDWGGRSAKLDCSQLDMLAHNDFPQGEFWPTYENGTRPVTGHANANIRVFIRGPVLAARREGRPLVSAEAFTHMHRHWSVDPAFLKPLADVCFADGINRLVWHTFTCSPKEFGVPGLEYFAGSHINRNVTWHREAKDFVHYLGRCQALLQQGTYVDDGEFLNVQTNYYGWGRFRSDPQAQFTMTHRRIGADDVFFVAGEGKGSVALPVELRGRHVEEWNPVTVTRRLADVQSAAGAAGRATSAKPPQMPTVLLDLPVGGSCFLVATDDVGEYDRRPKVAPCQMELSDPWEVDFRYPDGIVAKPPEHESLELLTDWTKHENLKYFAGTAIYRQCVAVKGSGRAILSLGHVPSGIAHVYVNGIDCGTVWCAPWEVDVTHALRDDNEIEIRYTNNWENRLIGDCRAPKEEQVTRTCLWQWKEDRYKLGVNPKAPSLRRPTIWSGYSAHDPLQSCGLAGPIVIKGRMRSARLRVAADSSRERRLGAPTVFTVGGSGAATVWADNCGRAVLLRKRTVKLVADKPQTFEVALDKPGFLRFHVDCGGRRASATVPYEPTKITACTPEPPDFDAYWQGELERLDREVPLNARMEKIVGHYGADGGFDEYKLTFDTFGGKRIHGFLASPKGAKGRLPVLVQIPGAGSGAAWAWDARPDSVVVSLNVHDFEHSLDEKVEKARYRELNDRMKAKYGGRCASYSTAGWGVGREEVHYHDAMLGIVRAIRWIADQPFADRANVSYFGGSQGAGCGYMAIALSGVFARAWLYITALSDLVCDGSDRTPGWPKPTELFEKGTKEYENACFVAPYFDAVNFARRIRCEVRGSIGLEDTTTLPPTAMASFNAIPGAKKKIIFEANVGHSISQPLFKSCLEWLATGVWP